MAQASVAIVYDFDGTLAPGNMQERGFIPAIGMGVPDFWTEVKRLAREHEGDEILAYMSLMLRRASANEVQVRKSDFEEYGSRLKLFAGVEVYRDGQGVQHLGWFDRINQYGASSGLNIDHFIISSGLREMIQGTPIGNYFKQVYASSFAYDHHGIATWPALAINYTTKTQYLFRINKGSLNVFDNDVINRFVDHNKRPVPFKNIIFIGDGDTDIPCFRLVKDLLGHSIAVYHPSKQNARKKPERLLKEERINYFAPANYQDGKRLDRIVKAILDKIQIDSHLDNFTS